MVVHRLTLFEEAKLVGHMRKVKIAETAQGLSGIPLPSSFADDGAWCRYAQALKAGFIHFSRYLHVDMNAHSYVIQCVCVCEGSGLKGPDVCPSLRHAENS